MASDSLEQVFLAHRPALERFLRARCGNAAEAEDLLQDLWLKLAGVMVPVAEPLAYLYRMADNLVLDRRRSAQRRERRDDAWIDFSGSGSAGVSDAPSAERAIIARGQLAQVAQAFDELGERTTAIFKSYRIDGVGQKEIAAQQGISLSAVEKHLQKAYRLVIQLRCNLDAEFGASDRHPS